MEECYKSSLNSPSIDTKHLYDDIHKKKNMSDVRKRNMWKDKDSTQASPFSVQSRLVPGMLQTGINQQQVVKYIGTKWQNKGLGGEKKTIEATLGQKYPNGEQSTIKTRWVLSSLPTVRYHDSINDMDQCEYDDLNSNKTICEGQNVLSGESCIRRYGTIDIDTKSIFDEEKEVIERKRGEGNKYRDSDNNELHTIEYIESDEFNDEIPKSILKKSSVHFSLNRQERDKSLDKKVSFSTKKTVYSVPYELRSSSKSPGPNKSKLLF